MQLFSNKLVMCTDDLYAVLMRGHHLITQ